MAHVKVWNRNKYDHKEKFKGDDIVIPAGSFITMEFEDAIQFKGQFTPLPPEDYVGDEAKFFKMIEVEWPKQHEDRENAHLVNHATGQVAASEAELKAALAKFAHLVVKDDEAEKASRGNSAQDARIASLEAQVGELIAALSAKEQKRGPGRPKKAEGATP